jgi:hypothetical protein
VLIVRFLIGRITGGNRNENDGGTKKEEFIHVVYFEKDQGIKRCSGNSGAFFTETERSFPLSYL